MKTVKSLLLLASATFALISCGKGGAEGDAKALGAKMCKCMGPAMDEMMKMKNVSDPAELEKITAKLQELQKGAEACSKELEADTKKMEEKYPDLKKDENSEASKKVKAALIEGIKSGGCTALADEMGKELK